MTFTKLFSSITESTVWCEDDQTRIVWITMLAMSNKHGFVFGSPPGLANRARVPVEAVRTALEKFLSPDPDSRTKDHEGRRLEVIDGGWRLLNYQKHRAIRNEEERTEYMKNYMREYRAQRPRKDSVNYVNLSKPPLSQAEAEAEAEANTKPLKSKAAHFVRPSLEEVTKYVHERGDKINPEAFCDFYDSKGWKVGNQSMKNWQAAVRTWEKRIQGKEGAKNGRWEEILKKCREVDEQIADLPKL